MSAVFGYGSLIWKSPPWHLDCTPGYIKGHVRRFAQASHDHRGTPQAPGRVVTLVTEQDWEQHRKDDPLGSHHVWGAFCTDYGLAQEVWAYLDHREKDGYSLRTVDVYGIDPHTGKEVVLHAGVLYVGETHNPSFAGGEPMTQLADHIAHARGPSGPNKEYLYNLAAAVRLLCPASEDAYLAQLERLVRERDPDSSSSSSLSLPQPPPLLSKVTPSATTAGAGSPDRLGARM
ncbi:ChaC-like protein [Rhodotorula sp. JG-1b]|nr:ChaC-like protein [Rhodotorula sp. JG-1b]